MGSTSLLFFEGGAVDRKLPKVSKRRRRREKWKTLCGIVDLPRSSASSVVHRLISCDVVEKVLALLIHKDGGDGMFVGMRKGGRVGC